MSCADESESEEGAKVGNQRGGGARDSMEWDEVEAQKLL